MAKSGVFLLTCVLHSSSGLALVLPPDSNVALSFHFDSNFSNVCPEPVLAKTRWFFSRNKMAPKDETFFCVAPRTSPRSGSSRSIDRRLTWCLQPPATATTSKRKDKIRQDKTRQDKTRAGQARPDQAKDKTRPGHARQDKTRSGQARQDKTRPGQATPGQARPDQTRQDKTPSLGFVVFFLA
jgi:hypothetical protein